MQSFIDQIMVVFLSFIKKFIDFVWVGISDNAYSIFVILVVCLKTINNSFAIIVPKESNCIPYIEFQIYSIDLKVISFVIIEPKESTFISYIEFQIYSIDLRVIPIKSFNYLAINHI